MLRTYVRKYTVDRTKQKPNYASREIYNIKSSITNKCMFSIQWCNKSKVFVGREIGIQTIHEAYTSMPVRMKAVFLF